MMTTVSYVYEYASLWRHLILVYLQETLPWYYVAVHLSVYELMVETMFYSDLHCDEESPHQTLMKMTLPYVVLDPGRWEVAFFLPFHENFVPVSCDWETRWFDPADVLVLFPCVCARDRLALFLWVLAKNLLALFLCVQVENFLALFLCVQVENFLPLSLCV